MKVFCLLLIISLLPLIKTVFAQEIYYSNTVITRVGNPQTTSVNFVFYCQADPRWVNNCSIGVSGCGPSSIAMIVSSFGLIKTPPEIDAVFQSINPAARACGGPSTIPNFFQSNWLESNGFTRANVKLRPGNTLDLEDAQNYLSKGYLILGSSAIFPCPASGYCTTPDKGINHIYVVDQVNITNNTFRARDPLNCRPERPQEVESDNIENNNFPWLYAYAIKKT